MEKAAEIWRPLIGSEIFEDKAETGGRDFCFLEWRGPGLGSQSGLDALTLVWLLPSYETGASVSSSVKWVQLCAYPDITCMKISHPVSA